MFVNLYYFLTISIIIPAQFSSAASEYVTVLTNTEKDIGYTGVIQILPGNEDKPLAVFKGIQYAQAPVGELRYKPPIPHEETEIRNTTEFTPPCLQWDLFSNKNVTGSENCLHLNVYKPNTIPKEGTTLYPVMIFFHGVGFIAGQSDTYNPEYLVYKDVIVITVQYRLGALGFLSTGDELQPGNMGLLDQVEAMRWVQKNIRHFGGDPDKVTIFGESAGAVSITLHLLSPLTKGLFRAAIIQSGTAIAPYAIQRNPMIHVQRLAANLGCISGNTSMLLECIKFSDPKEVVASDAYTAAGGATGRKASRSYKKPPNPGPVIQPEVTEGWPTFLLEDPLVVLSDGRFHKVPVVIGVNRDESASAVISNLFPKLINATANDPTYPERSFLKKVVKSSGFKNNTDVIKAAVKFEYFKDYNMSDVNELKDEYIALHSDFSVVAPVYSTALYLSQHTSVYFYTFEYEGEMSFSQILSQVPPDNNPEEKKKKKRRILKRDLIGNTFHITPEIAAELEQISQEVYHMDETRYVIHGEELLYVFRFRNPSNGVLVDIEDEEGKHVRDIVTTLWTNTAKYTSPTEVLSPEIVAWKAFTQDGPYTMRITERASLLISYRHRKMLFWTHHVQQLQKLQLCT